MNRYGIRILIALAGVVALMWADRSMAYSTYTGSTCASSSCHDGFVDKGALHDTHTAITNVCTMCHPSSPGSKPVSTSSANNGFSCLGCHGRDYGSTIGLQSAGLRTLHAAKGVNTCSGCHSGDPTPLPENVLPPHYLRAELLGFLSCSDNLDNDGDGASDGNDTDCSVPVEDTTWGKIKALYK